MRPSAVLQLTVCVKAAAAARAGFGVGRMLRAVQQQRKPTARNRRICPVRVGRPGHRDTQKSIETDGSDLDKVADPAEGAEVVVLLDKAAVACGLHTRPGSVTTDFLLKRGEPKSEQKKS